VSRDQPEPSRELSSGAEVEVRWIAYRHDERGRRDRSHTRNRRQPPADLVGPVPAEELALEPGDLLLNFAQLRDHCHQDLPGQRRNAVVVGLCEERHEFAYAPNALRNDHAELGQVAAKRIGKLRALGNQEVAGPVEQQHGLLLEALTGTKRIDGRVKASQIASASAASFLFQLS
jgi:hypothetical protein